MSGSGSERDGMLPTAGPLAEPAPRSPRLRLMLVVRRLHLYLGLFLLPWAILYGVTGFLFNHPSAFADAPTATFGRPELVGTPMENPPAPAEVAAQVVAALNARGETTRYSLIQPENARYTREFAFATVKADDQGVGVLFDVAGDGGTVRSRALPPPRAEIQAPFAVGGGLTLGAPKLTGSARSGLSSLDAPLHERVKAAVPVVLERTGFPRGEVTVTSVPDLTFAMKDGERTWLVTYQALTGTVSGIPAEEAPPQEELSTRRFLLRLHVAHGFPAATNARWFWAIIVDAMSLVLVFWGVSGIFMWWQVKATRRTGFLVLILSIAAATALGLGMHHALTAR